jgi:4-aminobutyrate aminotransferase/(S)-3-amino-2-methylpropionate transaminase
MILERTQTESLRDLQRSQVARGVSITHDLFVERAQGARVWDTDGRSYLDFVGGIGVLNLGHRHPRVVAAVAAQLEAFTHTCFQVAMYEGYVELARRLNALTPGDFAKKTLLVTTGAEAAENAVKIARAATGRSAVITFTRGYHGRTFFALAMTAKTSPYKQNFGPFPGDVYHAPYPHEFAGWPAQRALDALELMFETDVAADRVAAIVIEPVLGEGGFVPAPAEFLRGLRRIADRHGIVLVSDEIQAGFGRTGKMFAIEHAGVVPDLVLVAKSLAGGLPLAGVIGRATIMDAPLPGGLGGTFAGNPLACAAALATLDAFAEDGLLERAQEIGARTHAVLITLATEHAAIVDVRGLGAMLAIELRDPAHAQRIIDAARERGLLLLKAGAGNVIRLLMPLTITDEELEEGLAILVQSCAAALVPAAIEHSSR